MNVDKKQRYSKKFTTSKQTRYRKLYLNRQRDIVSDKLSRTDKDVAQRKSITYTSSINKVHLKRQRLSSKARKSAQSKARIQSTVTHPKKKDRLNEYQGYTGDQSSQVEMKKEAQKDNHNKQQTVSSQKRSDKATSLSQKNQKETNPTYAKTSAHKKSSLATTSIHRSRKITALARKKVDDSLKKNVTSKNVFRNKIKEMMVDTIGRDENGELNIVGIILAVLLLIPVLFVLIKVVLIASIVIAIISIFIAIWTFIASLFTIKTEDMALEEAYRFITYLDAQKNKEVNEHYNQLIEDEDNHEVYFILNGVRSNPNNFVFNSNGDTYLYFLNAKYERYDLNSRSISEKYWRPPFGATIREEVQGIHDYTFHWETEFEEQEIEQLVLVENEETGEIEEKIQTETVRIALILVTWSSIAAYLNDFPDELSADALDKFEPIQELDRFESKIFLENPLGKRSHATVIEKYGHRGRDISTRFHEMVLSANDGDAVYASSNETVVSVRENMVISDTPLSKQIRYINLKNIQVKVGQKLTSGQKIGETTGNLEIRVAERRSWPHSDAILYPAAYIDHLVFSYPENTGFHDAGGGLTGNLINPPDSVLQWRELVAKACEKNGILGFENVILAIIWEESGGTPIQTGTDSDGEPILSMDIMQASESLGLPLNSLKTVEESINAGVAYFAAGLRLVEENNLDKRTAIQAYNFGHGFIQWLVDGEEDYSFDMARLFSREKSSGRTVTYRNPIAQRMGFTWRYDYGNMFYVELITQHIMVSTGELIQIAKEEIGYPNGDKYWQWFGLANRVEWCAIFVSWVADQAGYLEQDRILKSASCIEMVRWFTARSQYQSATESYVPKEGDLIFFDWNGNRTGKDHVGIVEYSDGRIVQTIEGNSGNAVRRQTYLIDSPVISGYGVTRSNNLE